MDKMIKELANTLEHLCLVDIDYDEADNLIPNYKGIADELIRVQGYRKLPKDSVVLSKEEFSQLLNNNIRADVEFLESELAKARKETAEKILFKFESAFAYYDNEDMFSKKAIFECLEELVKQFGVNLGDN